MQHEQLKNPHAVPAALLPVQQQPMAVGRPGAEI